MAGVKALRKIQLGRESAAGTAVAATTYWRGEGVLEDKREVTFPNEDVGLLSGTDRSYIARYLAELALDATPLTFEQGPHLFEMGVKAATATQDGAGTDYLYSYPMPTATPNTTKTYTIETGDNQQAEEMEYCHATEIKLTGKAGEAVMVSATIGGRQVTDTSFTGALSIPTVEEVLFSKGKLYIDAVGGTLGSTQKTSTLLSMEMNIKTGLQPVWTADGQLYFTFVKTVMPEIVTKLVFEHDSISTALKTDFRAGTARQIRLLFEGSTVGTPGTTYSKKTFRIDQAAKVESVAKLGEVDGNDVLEMSFRSRYNSTAALFCNVLFVNELSALP